MDEQIQTLKIDADIYNLLRDYCDKNGIRFRNFVEDSLENAIQFEESDKIHREEIENLKMKATKYDYAFTRGFQKGFLFAFFALQGRCFYSLKEDEIIAICDNPFQISGGTQLPMFQEDEK